MNKAFILKATRLAQRVEEARQRWSDLDEEFVEFKRGCDHRTPEGKLTTKLARVPKQGSRRAYTFKVCCICGEDVYKDCYGRMISVWNHLEIPEERMRELEKMFQD